MNIMVIKNTCFIFGTEDHYITNIPKLNTSDKKVHWNRENPKTGAYWLKMLENRTDQRDSYKIYASYFPLLS